ncbi:MAG: hypothetical protein JKY67_21575 [Pseudomonadales bacterium]|nr:hypothetical protein [Pseudomonadales bacterium]
MINLAHSPTDKITFRGRDYFLKRDDLLAPAFSGNKARKFYYLLDGEFPGIKKIIGHGSPQANSLYTLSELAKLKNWQFDFYVDHVPSFLNKHPAGNYRAALANGANIIALKTGPLKREKYCGGVGEYIQQVILPEERESIFVPEGGRVAWAELGVKRLAEEILLWSQKNKIRSLKIALPSGTGTTAVFLQKHLPFEVLTCACVGGEEYLKKQFMELSTDQSTYPTILSARKKYHFGKLYDEYFTLWKALKTEVGVEFDLLYDPLGWLTLLDHVARSKSDEWEILYIHQGGLLGNETMLPRYLRVSKQSRVIQPRFLT